MHTFGHAIYLCAMDSPILRVEELRKIYRSHRRGDVIAVDGVSFRAYEFTLCGHLHEPQQRQLRERFEFIEIQSDTHQSKIQVELLKGTLEQLAMSPLGFGRVLLSRLAAAFLFDLLVMLLFLLLMMASTGKWLHLDLLSLLPLLLLTMAGVLGIGFIMGGLALVFKQIQASLSSSSARRASAGCWDTTELKLKEHHAGTLLLGASA